MPTENRVRDREGAGSRGGGEIREGRLRRPPGRRPAPSGVEWKLELPGESGQCHSGRMVLGRNLVRSY